MPADAAAGERPRVVVTGLGAVTAMGVSVPEFWDGVRAGRVAITEVEHMSLAGYRTKLAGEVKADFAPAHPYLQPGGFRDRALDFTVRAAEEAMAGCGAGVGAIPAERWGCVIGTCYGGILAWERWYRCRRRGEPVDPKLVLLVHPQASADAVSGAFGLKGPVLSIDTACAASANAIGYAAELIRAGHADAMLAGGSDSLSELLMGGFNSLQSLSPEPAAPYSIDRKGLSVGEGGGMLVLMSEPVARDLGARPLAELLGYGLSADGYHPTAPHPQGLGAARAIRKALTQSGVDPAEVAYINSHGTGTAKNDPAETAATKAALGEGPARSVALSSTKSMIGHLIGGSGAVEAVATVKAITDQVAPPTANITQPDPECDLDYVPNVARPMAIDVAVSNNFAFGGANTSVVFARPGARNGGPPAPPLDRVVITGISALTSVGTDLDKLFGAYRDGRDCTASENGTRIARVPLAPADFLSPRDRKRIDRIGLFAIISAKLALADAGLDLTDESRTRVGTVLGTGAGPIESIEEFSAGMFEGGVAGANPAIYPNTVYNAAGGQVAIKLGAVGSASTLTAGHAASASALGFSYDLTSLGTDDAVICIAADALTELLIAGYRELGALAGDDGHEGIALGEAGIALIVERRGRAQARGARCYGELLGYGATSDALGIGRIDTEGTGVQRAMRAALASAGIDASAVAAVWSAACGLPSVDAAEANAIDRLLGSGLPVLRPKLKLGEPIGAGTALCAALALKGWAEGEDELSPRGPILVNGMSLGGSNISIVLTPVSN